MPVRPRPPRFRLRTLLATIAMAAVLLAVGTPRLRRALGYPNTWVVRTVTRADGTVVRRRVRRLPDRDRVFEEVLIPPGPARQPERSR